MPITNAIPSGRISPANNDISKELGFLAELAGTWHGKGFNLIARPDGLGANPYFSRSSPPRCPRAVQLAARLWTNAPQDFRRAIVGIGNS